MALVLPAAFMTVLICYWFQCEIGSQPPYLFLKMAKQRKLLSAKTGRSNQDRGPIVHTKLGPVEGFVGHNADGREIYKFTGIPYGEAPIGHLRFRSPILRKPWKKILKATSESPFCLQINGATMGMLRGQEDCLYLDVHSPKLPNPDGKNQAPRLPVIIWIPAGANLSGRSLYHGSSYLLREDVVLVVINVRLGVLGYLATGDEASPGNWGLKDVAVAVQWVHDNIAAFGGDPDRIIIGGFSAGSAAAHSMLFTKHESVKYIKGIFGMSGSVLSNHDLDGKGRVVEASNSFARMVGCPSSKKGGSWEMVECLRKINPYKLTAYQHLVYLTMPPMVKMLGPTIEPNVTDAFITELPETLYEKGEVPPIPLILTRTQGEFTFWNQGNRVPLAPLFLLNWQKWISGMMTLAYRNTKLDEHVTEEQKRASIRKLTRFYFGRDTPPNISSLREYRSFFKMVNDGLYNMPCWKGLELHNKIAPTYSFVSRHRTVRLNPWVRLIEKITDEHYGTSHMSEFPLLFNNTSLAPPLTGSDFDIASKNLINFIANFATYGKPLYRTTLGELLPLWTTIGDVNHMRVLDVGLVHNITMVIDPLPSTMRKQIWEELKF